MFDLFSLVAKRAHAYANSLTIPQGWNITWILLCMIKSATASSRYWQARRSEVSYFLPDQFLQSSTMKLLVFKSKIK